MKIENYVAVALYCSVKFSSCALIFSIIFLVNSIKVKKISNLYIRNKADIYRLRPIFIGVNE